MEQFQVVSLKEGRKELYVLGWPPDAETASFGLCMVIMKRTGGMLLGLPVGFIPLVDLQGGGADLVGPHTTLSVPAVSMVGEEQLDAGFDLDVLVVDMSEEAVHSLVPFSMCEVEEGDISGFTADLGMLPDPMRLLSFTREWVNTAGGEQVAFYSAEEAPEAMEGEAAQVPKSKAKAKVAEKAKRPSAAQVAEHITVMSKMLPQMFNQLSAMQEEQQRLQRLVEQSAAVPAPRASQMPVSMPLQSFAKMMGSPPRTKQLGLPFPPPKASPMNLEGQNGEEEQFQVQGENTLAQAVLQQSLALTSLVAHFQQGGDPLLDPQGTASSISSRGAAGRERLQKELSLRTGGFSFR